MPTFIHPARKSRVPSRESRDKRCRVPSPETRDNLLTPKHGFQLLATRYSRLATVFLMLAGVAAWAQANPPKSTPERATQAHARDSAPKPDDVSGMYTFLREGEFVEVDVEPDGRVTGFISRYGERDSDRGAFLDHMFTKGSMQGNKLAFTTRSVHGVSFEFKGTVDRGEGKAPGAEAYHVIKGTLTQMTEDKDHKTSAQQREVEFKSFPADAIMAPRKKD
jgi:hypothetical protein